MRFFGKKKEESQNSVVLDSLDKGKQFTAKMFDFIFCSGVALTIGYVYAKYNM